MCCGNYLHITVAKHCKKYRNFIWFSGVEISRKDTPHSFGRVARNYAETCLSAKFPHQEIRWNFGIFRSENSFILREQLLLEDWWKKVLILKERNMKMRNKKINRIWCLNFWNESNKIKRRGWKRKQNCHLVLIFHSRNKCFNKSKGYLEKLLPWSTYCFVRVKILGTNWRVDWWIDSVNKQTAHNQLSEDILVDIGKLE